MLIGYWVVHLFTGRRKQYYEKDIVKAIKQSILQSTNKKALVRH